MNAAKERREILRLIGRLEVRFVQVGLEAGPCGIPAKQRESAVVVRQLWCEIESRMDAVAERYAAGGQEYERGLVDGSRSLVRSLMERGWAYEAARGQVPEDGVALRRTHQAMYATVEALEKAISVWPAFESWQPSCSPRPEPQPSLGLHENAAAGIGMCIFRGIDADNGDDDGRSDETPAPLVTQRKRGDRFKRRGELQPVLSVNQEAGSNTSRRSAPR